LSCCGVVVVRLGATLLRTKSQLNSRKTAAIVVDIVVSAAATWNVSSQVAGVSEWLLNLAVFPQ